jgi:DNA-binding GntR family transcriptional regulator
MDAATTITTRGRRYLDIAEQLASELTGLPPGARVAGEHDITLRFGVGRAAARAALQELERRLLVRRIQGAGTFVNRRIDYVISHDRRPSWHETVSAAGAQPRTVVRGVDVVALPPEPAALLDLPPGTPAHRLRRQSYIDDLLAAATHEWIPVAIVPELGAALHAAESVDLVLRQVGRVCPVRSWSRVSLDVPPPDVVAGLQMDSTAPVWLVESLSRDGDTGSPVMCSSSWMRADALRVVVELGEGRGGAV